MLRAMKDSVTVLNLTVFAFPFDGWDDLMTLDKVQRCSLCPRREDCLPTATVLATQ